MLVRCLVLGDGEHLFSSPLHKEGDGDIRPSCDLRVTSSVGVFWETFGLASQLMLSPHGNKMRVFFCLLSFVFPQPLFDLVSVTRCPRIFSNPTRQILVFTRPLYCKLKLKMDAKELILLLGWFEGPWRAEPALHSHDVSRTSRWLSPRELPYLPDKDYIPLGGIPALNRSRLVFFPQRSLAFEKN